MTTAVNDSIVFAVQQDQQAAADKEAARHAKAKAQAMETYLAILSDDSRTSDADKAAFAAAIKVLGFTMDVVNQDALAIQQAAACADESSGFAARQEEAAEAYRVMMHFCDKVRPEAHRKIEEEGKRLRDAHEAAAAKAAEALKARSIAREIMASRPHLASVLPKI